MTMFWSEEHFEGVVRVISDFTPYPPTPILVAWCQMGNLLLCEIFYVGLLLISFGLVANFGISQHMHKYIVCLNENVCVHK